MQPRCVVLFDEIDSFLLHRDSKRYREQDTAFQFMTPGMLTKLNDLRREKVVLCVIATNYDNRIDPAIKRTGRVDKRYLVLPPDLGARRRILRELVTKENAKMAGGGRLRGKRSADWDALAKESLFLGYTDIEGAVIDARRQSTGGNFSTQLMKCLKERARTTKISNYAARLASKDDYDHPIEELICLIGMALQEGYPLDQASENTLIELQKKLRLLGGNISEAIRLSAPGLKQHVRKQVARAFALVA